MPRTSNLNRLMNRSMNWLMILLVMVCAAGMTCCPARGDEPRAALSAAGFPAAVTMLLADMPGAGGLAASVNGQTAYCIDEERRAVVSLDPFAPGRRRDVVAPASEELPMPVAVGCLPGDLLAVACRQGDEWQVQTHRIRPGVASDPAKPVQTLAVGRAGGAIRSVGIAVSQSRDWLAVVGIPPPLPPVLRAVFAGAGMRSLSDAGWPAGVTGSRPLAIAVSSVDEMVLLDATDAAAPAAVVFHGPTGRELLRLDTGLTQVRGLACARDGSAVWVIAGEPDGVDQPEGLWRLDAVLRDGRQAVRPVCIARLEAPRSIAAVSDRSVVVVHGTDRRTIVRIDPNDETLAHHKEMATP